MAMVIERRHNLLKPGKHYREVCAKDRIVLHHTQGGSARSSVDWWNSQPGHVCTPYLIERDGTVLEVYPPEHWSYALGIGSAAAEKRSVHVELCSHGPLREDGGELFRLSGSPFRGEHIAYGEPWRGHSVYERYTKEQVEATIGLLGHLVDRFGMEVGDLDGFWHYDAKSGMAVISHTTVRRDKSDIHPQPDLVGGIQAWQKARAR